MAGITILQTVTPIAEVTVLIGAMCGIVVLVCGALAVGWFRCDGICLAAIVFTILAILGLIAFIINIKHPMYEKTKYQVVLEDTTISINDFTQQYNIIEQEGIIYWVTEK